MNETPPSDNKPRTVRNWLMNGLQLPALGTPGAAGHEPLQITEGQTTDLGPLPDQVRPGGGGWPDMAGLDLDTPEMAAAWAILAGPHNERPKRRRISSFGYTFTNADWNIPRPATPSGVDSADIVRIVISCATPVRVCTEINQVSTGSLAGASFLHPAGGTLTDPQPLYLTTGPVWVHLNTSPAGNVPVFILCEWAESW